MANPTLFGSSPAVTHNRAGGVAYALSPNEALAQYAGAGMLGGTFYASAQEQLDEVLKIALQCHPLFVAQCAVYARRRGYLKDMPALLLASLTSRFAADHNARAAFSAAFPLVIDNGRMLRNFVQIVRSNRIGRKSFGTTVKRQIQNWINGRRVDQLLRDSVGEKPSIGDVIKMVHPNPQLIGANATGRDKSERAALYGYLTGPRMKVADHKSAERRMVPRYEPTELPALVQDYELFKRQQAEPGGSRFAPPRGIDFRMLDSLGLNDAQWKEVARHAPWQMTRMNLNTFERHGVLNDPELVSIIAKRLADPEEVRRSRCFPYQLLQAFRAVAPLDYAGNVSRSSMPLEIVNALNSAMEVSVENVPTFDGLIAVCPDVSGSMRSPVTGQRGSATTSVRYCDVSGLVAAVMLRRSPECVVLPFDTQLHLSAEVMQKRPIAELAQKIAAFGGGGTCCELPLMFLNQQFSPSALAKLQAVIYVSDNESWVSAHGYSYGMSGRGTTMQAEWLKLKRMAPQAKLICIDVAAGVTTQAQNDVDRLNVAGFSDAVFDVMGGFMRGCDSRSYWVDEISRIAL